MQAVMFICFVIVSVAPMPLLALSDRPHSRRALLIGIGDYPQTGPRPWRRLRVGQEVALYRQVLARHHGFRDEDILTLEDDRATGKAIREAVRRHLIEAAQPGAVLVLHFSGHGHQ